MIHVKIELIPGGDKERRRTLSEMVIVNDGTGTAAAGNYVVVMRSQPKPGGPMSRPPAVKWYRGAIHNFPRLEASADILVRQALGCLIPVAEDDFLVTDADPSGDLTAEAV